MAWTDHIVSHLWATVSGSMPVPPLEGLYRTHGGHDWHHWGVMIPRMAPPFGYLDVVVTMGLPGFEFFTVPSETRGTPGNTALLLVASGGLEPLHRSFDIQASCTSSTSDAGPVSLRMGEVLMLEGDHPRWTVRADMPEQQVDLEITCTDDATWFSRLPGIYDHVGLAATYRGTVTVGGDIHHVEGPCSCEHAYGASATRMPGQSRLPIRLFNYEVMSLDDGRMLLLAKVGRASDALWLQGAWLKGASQPRHFSSVDKVITAAQAATTPDGRVMHVPTAWSTMLSGSGGTARLEMQVDTELTYGLGRGFVAGYRFSGTLLGEPVAGRGYLEFVDVTTSG